MPAPTFQAAGAPAQLAGAGTIAPAWPAHQAGDVALLLVESHHDPVMLQTPNGFREVPASPRFDTMGGVNKSRTTVFWCRATSGAMAAPVVYGVGDHRRGIIITFRGVRAGTPWDTYSGGDSAGSSPNTITIPGATTSTANCLVVAIVCHGSSNALAQLSGWANASLTGVTEILDNPSTVGEGSHLAAATGVKAAAGAYGNTTVNGPTGGLGALGFMTIALASEGTLAEDTSTPYVHGFGQPVESATVAVSPAWPPHQANDIGLLLVESGGWPVTLSVAAGFVEVSSSPQNAGVSGSTSSASLKVYWKRATGAAESAPTVSFVADHIRAQIITVRGAATSGNPWDVSAGSLTASATTAVTHPGVTTTKNNTRLVHMLGHSAGSDITRHTAPVNVGLTELQKFEDSRANVGGGSGFVIVSGKRASAGATGDTTQTSNQSVHQGRITLAIKPIQLSQPLDRIQYAYTLNAAGMRFARKIVANRIQYTLTLNNLNFLFHAGYVLEAGSMSFNSTIGNAVFRKRLGRWERTDVKSPGIWTKRTPITN